MRVEVEPGLASITVDLRSRSRSPKSVSRPSLERDARERARQVATSSQSMAAMVPHVSTAPQSPSAEDPSSRRRPGAGNMEPCSPSASVRSDGADRWSCGHASDDLREECACCQQRLNYVDAPAADATATEATAAEAPGTDPPG